MAIQKNTSVTLGEHFEKFLAHRLKPDATAQQAKQYAQGYAYWRSVRRSWKRCEKH